MERLLLECTVRAVLIAIGTGAILRTMRVKTASARHAAWTAVVLLMLLLPAWTAWGPKATVRALPPAPAPISSAPAPMPSRTVELAPRAAIGSRQAYLLGIYLAGAGILLLRLAIGTARAIRLTSASCVAPVTVGVFRPRIILPESSSQWPRAQLDAVLTHEGEHVHRRDPLVQWLALFNRAVFWFHPLAWWLERRLSALAEEACDAAVLARGHDPCEYSGYLLELARCVERAGMRVDVVGMAMPGSCLPQRVKNIIDGVRAPRISRARMACTAAALVISFAVFAAGSLDRAVAVHEPRPDGQGWERNVRPSPASEGGGSPAVLVAQVRATPPRAAPVPPAPAPFSITMDFDYAQLNPAEYSVRFAVKIPGSELELAHKTGAEQTTIHFEGQVKDDFGTGVTVFSRELNIDLSGAAAAELASRPIQYDARVVLLPGNYTLKLLARDNETGRLGTFETPFVIPNLNKEH